MTGGAGGAESAESRLGAADPAELLNRRGLRATPQRQAVIDALRSAGGHVTAEEVYGHVRADLPTISLKTVYEALHALVAAGEVQELVVGSEPIRFDSTVRPHHHLICMDCRRIRDVDFDLSGADVPEGFSVVRTDVVAWGRCTDCVSNSS